MSIEQLTEKLNERQAELDALCDAGASAQEVSDAVARVANVRRMIEQGPRSLQSIADATVPNGTIAIGRKNAKVAAKQAAYLATRGQR